MHARFSALLLVCGILAAGVASAQTPPQPQAKAHLEAAFTWDGVRASAAGGNGFWMQGAGFQLHDRFWRGLGVVADITGTHIVNINSSGVGLDLLTATFGPRYTWSRRKVSLYGQGLVGEAFSFNTLVPSPHGADSSDNSLAALAGGGVNVAVSPRVAVRLVEADWLLTQMPNSAGNTQNDLRLSAGVVFRFR